MRVSVVGELVAGLGGQCSDVESASGAHAVCAVDAPLKTHDRLHADRVEHPGRIRYLTGRRNTQKTLEEDADQEFGRLDARNRAVLLDVAAGLGLSRTQPVGKTLRVLLGEAIRKQRTDEDKRRGRAIRDHSAPIVFGGMTL